MAGLTNNPGSANGSNSIARFNNPTGIAMDTAGNVYVTDFGNNTIRKLMAISTNWAVTTLAAVLGAASLSPITGGHGALPWQETVVTAGFMTVGIAIVAASVLVLWGLRRTAVS